MCSVFDDDDNDGGDGGHTSPYNSQCTKILQNRVPGLHNNESEAFYLLCKSDFIRHKCALMQHPNLSVYFAQRP